MENIETGLLLMVVGMTTVFAILLIVINLGKGLIVLVNKYAPEEIIAKKPVAAAVRVQTATPTQTTAIGSLSGQETAAIVFGNLCGILLALYLVDGSVGRVVEFEFDDEGGLAHVAAWTVCCAYL